MTVPEIPLIPLNNGTRNSGTRNNGTSIPQIGLGTWALDDDAAARIVPQAVELGYRHIDTAVVYHNEVGVGRGVRSSGVPREELFVTTKLAGEYQGDEKAVAGLEESLRRLDLEYVDLLLIHWPLPEDDLFVSTWRTFERLLEQGKTRAIGVSNFKPAHLRTLMAQTAVVPAVNQIEVNPLIPREDHRHFDADHGIVSVSYTPLGRKSDLLESPILTQLGTVHGKSPAQIVLRWHVQLGLVPIPKSARRERLAENIDVFDFELSDAEMLALDKLSIAGPPGVDSDVDGH